MDNACNFGNYPRKENGRGPGPVPRPKQALAQTGSGPNERGPKWLRAKAGAEWALGPNGLWAQGARTGPGPKWALGPMGRARPGLYYQGGFIIQVGGKSTPSFMLCSALTVL